MQWQRRYDEAAVAAREALELDPQSPVAHLQLARSLVAKKEYVAALAEFDQSDSINVWIYQDPGIRAALTRGDESAYWRLLLERMKLRASRSYVPASFFAILYAHIGKRDSVMVWLGRAFAGPDAGLFSVLQNPALDPFRSDPFFVALLKKHRLAP